MWAKWRCLPLSYWGQLCALLSPSFELASQLCRLTVQFFYQKYLNFNFRGPKHFQTKSKTKYSWLSSGAALVSSAGGSWQWQLEHLRLDHPSQSRMVVTVLNDHSVYDIFQTCVCWVATIDVALISKMWPKNHGMKADVWITIHRVLACCRWLRWRFYFLLF